MVERVILTAEGQVQQIEWKPPFSYIQGLKDGHWGGQGKSKLKKAKKERTSNPKMDAGSLPSAFGAPTGTLRQIRIKPRGSNVYVGSSHVPQYGDTQIPH
jgi:hypothetical protein